MIELSVKDKWYDDLRKRAAVTITPETPDYSDVDNLTKTELVTLISELQLHQQELEIQNDDLRFMQQDLQDARDIYIDLYDNAPVGYLLLSHNGLIKKTNLTLSKMLGVDKRTLINNVFSKFIDINDATNFYLHRQMVLDKKYPKSCQVLITATNDTKFYANLEISLQTDIGSKNTLLQITVSDISKIKEIEEERIQLIREKNQYYQEIQQRIKNSMGLLSSLIDVQLTVNGNPAQTDEFKEIRNRISAMMLIHNQSDQSASFVKINARNYFTSLLAYIFYSLDAYDNNIQFETSIDDSEFDIETLLPCGLIINELVSNSIQHAFHHQNDGIISVGMRLNLDGSHVLTVKDNGVRFPPNFDVSTNNALCMQIIRILAMRINGDIYYSNISGNSFQIQFTPFH
jgi:PAS domain S-box-containing protein